VESKKIRNKRHYVYDTKEEFMKDHPKGILHSEWRDAKEGDWVLSDDKRIVQLLKVSDKLSHPKDSKNYKQSKGYVRTIVGTFINSKKTNMDTDFEKHPNRYTFSTKIKNTSSRVKERSNCTNREKIFATSVAVGKDAVSAYMKAFSEANQGKARKKAVVLLKQERVMSEIEKTSKEIAKQLGIDHAYILGSLKQLADTSEDQNIALQSLKELGKAIGTLGNQVKRIETGVVGMFQGFSPDEIEGASRAILPETTSKEDK
jgi:hypothetical protein